MRETVGRSGMCTIERQEDSGKRVHGRTTRLSPRLYAIDIDQWSQPSSHSIHVAVYRHKVEFGLHDTDKQVDDKALE